MSKIPFLILLLFFCLSCNDVEVKKNNGQWYLDDHLYKTKIVEFNISHDSIRVVDPFGTTFSGIVRNNKFQINLPNNKREEIVYNFKDSLITIFDSIVFYKKKLKGTINQKTVVDLIGINTNIKYPFDNNKTVDRYEDSSIGKTVHLTTSIVLLNTTNPRKYLAGDTNLAVSELYNSFRSSRCSNGRPLNYRYNEVAILLEKNVSVADLVILEQFFLLYHHVRNFILITECTGINTYNAVFDKRIHFNRDYHTIEKSISEYTEREQNILPPPPSRAPAALSLLIPPNKSIEKYINSINGEIVLLSSFDEYKSKRKKIIRNRKKIVIKLSQKMKIDDYIYILRDFQNLRMKGIDFKVHILS